MNELELLNQLQDYWEISICVGVVMVVISGINKWAGK